MLEIAKVYLIMTLIISAVSKSRKSSTRPDGETIHCLGSYYRGGYPNLLVLHLFGMILIVGPCLHIAPLIPFVLLHVVSLLSCFLFLAGH